MFASDSRVSATASGSRPRVVSSASMTLGPPGWQTHQPMSSMVRSWSARKRLDVLADVAADHLGHGSVEDDPQPGAADVEAHGALGVGVEPAARVEDVRLRRRPVERGPGGDDGRGAVTEEPAGDQVGHRRRRRAAR